MANSKNRRRKLVEGQLYRTCYPIVLFFTTTPAVGEMKFKNIFLPVNSIFMYLGKAKEELFETILVGSERIEIANHERFASLTKISRILNKENLKRVYKPEEIHKPY